MVLLSTLYMNFNTPRPACLYWTSATPPHIHLPGRPPITIVILFVFRSLLIPVRLHLLFSPSPRPCPPPPSICDLSPPRYFLCDVHDAFAPFPRFASLCWVARPVARPAVLRVVPVLLRSASPPQLPRDRKINTVNE